MFVFYLFEVKGITLIGNHSVHNWFDSMISFCWQIKLDISCVRYLNILIFSYSFIICSLSCSIVCSFIPYMSYFKKILKNHKRASEQLLLYLFLKPLPLLYLIISHFGQSDYEKPDNRGTTSTAKKPLPKAPENGKFSVIICSVERPCYCVILYIHCSNNSK